MLYASKIGILQTEERRIQEFETKCWLHRISSKNHKIVLGNDTLTQTVLQSFVESGCRRGEQQEIMVG